MTAVVGSAVTLLSGQWYTNSGVELRVQSVTNTEVKLNLWLLNASPPAFGSGGNSILFNPSSGVWSDGSSANQPGALSATSTNSGTTSVGGYPAQLYGFGDTTTQTGIMFAMNTPSWAASSTSTEGTSVTSGTLVYDVPTSEITWTIGSDSPSSSSIVSYAISGPNNYVQSLTHTTGSPSTAGITSATSLAGYWQLGASIDGHFTSLATLQIGGNSSANKKVHCNFW